MSMYDSTRPQLIPADVPVAALYQNGLFAASPSQQERFIHRVMKIDVLATAPTVASILDIETGDATPDSVPAWANARYEANHAWFIRLYCNLSTWPAVKAAVATLSPEVRGRVRYWIANPTGTAHIVPGASATQWAWGAEYDISAYNSSWGA